MAEKPQPVQVLYCQVCSLPAEYCEFGPDFEKCKPWLIQNAPDIYPDLVQEADNQATDKVSEKLQSVEISSDGATPPATSGWRFFVQLVVAVLAFGAIDVNHKNEIYDGKVSLISNQTLQWNHIQTSQSNYLSFYAILDWR
ncbi:Translation initiation factor sui1 family protein [Thalictrum thalictroides]|uniref:Translation initiation factor sui1 family protein n=1 Tax=Thalictrum thalictroides TaxID=46969 RepID=A0A7J6XGT2_THATH|nr:Translation initiation factor sui1 family protein [Thalictrum thalictroides]